MSVKKVLVRDASAYDTALYDPGVDCSVFDPAGGPRNDGLKADAPLPSMAKQEFADECDINSIMRRYETTGQVDHVNRRAPQWGDFATSVDFHEAMNIVLEAEDRFAALPAEVRARFGNDPEQMLRFLEDPANRDEAIELGLVKVPDPEAPPQKVEVVNPPQPDGAGGATGGPGGAPA